MNETEKFPRLLLKLGPIPVLEIEKLRLYAKACRAYQEDGARSIRQAHHLSCGLDGVSRELFRDALIKVEMLFRLYFGVPVDLFDKLNKRQGWIGLKDHGFQALEITEEFISWYDGFNIICCEL